MEKKTHTHTHKNLCKEIANSRNNKSKKSVEWNIMCMYMWEISEKKNEKKQKNRKNGSRNISTQKKSCEIEKSTTKERICVSVWKKANQWNKNGISKLKIQFKNNKLLKTNGINQRVY